MPDVTAILKDARWGPDVDLYQEDIRLPDGTRLTSQLAEEFTDRVLEDAGRPGRPSLSGERRPSPHITIRLPDDLRAEAERVARNEGTTVSALTREALIERLRQAG